METLYFASTTELKKEKSLIERRLNVEITLAGRKATISGEPVAEYEALMVLEAIQFGFSAKEALSLLSDDTVFRKIPIKSFTRRKNLKEVRGRVIGKEGKTKRTIEQISGCDVVINDKRNEVGLIGPAEFMDEATTAVGNLIRGSKQANVYRFLERMNASKRKLDSDLGLKLKKKE